MLEKDLEQYELYYKSNIFIDFIFFLYSFFHIRLENIYNIHKNHHCPRSVEYLKIIRICPYIQIIVQKPLWYAPGLWYDIAAEL